MSRDVAIRMLGEFTVHIDGRDVGPTDWPSRRARELVALLALSERRRLVRDHVIEQLWPHLDVEAGAANLRKAAHHARRALDASDAVVLRGDVVELFPGRRVTTDAEAFLARADAALREGRPPACAEVAATWRGELLPDAPYDAWTQEARHRVHGRLIELLRRSGDLERLLEVEPTDEPACRELMRRAIADGRRHDAIRRYEELRVALARTAGMRPAPQTRALYDRCTDRLRLREAVFVGRELEIAEAMTTLAGTRRRRDAAALLVRGTVGIGKSALCREIAQRASDDGWRVLTTTGTPSRPPYGPIASALEGLLIGAPGVVGALPERTRSVLAELTPVVGTAAPLPGSPTRHQVIAAVRRALGADAVATLLVLDDAHLADEATAEVVQQLVLTGAGCPLVVAAACRAEWIRTSLPAGIAVLGRSQRTVTITLGPLGVRELARIVVAEGGDAAARPDVAEAVARAADGSPFFALELARAPSPERLPPTVREAVGARFLTLDPALFDPLAMLALTPGELDLATVLALTGLSEDAAFGMLDAALDAGVLVVEGGRYAFRHELIRQTLTEDLPPHQRARLHRDAAERLAVAGAAPELVADHHVAGGREGAAVPWLLKAAQAAVRLGAFADALARVDRLLAADPAHAEGLRLRARALDALGDERAPDAYAAAARAVGPGEAQELIAMRALAQLKASDPVSAVRTLEGCTPSTTEGRLAEALTLSAAAAVGVYADAETAEAKADEAHRLAVELGDPGAILDATWAHALAAHANGRLPARLRAYLHGTAQLPELATRVFDGQLCVTERMLHGAVPNEEIIAFADRLRAEAERLGAVRGQAFACTLRGEAGVLAGRLGEADADFASGADLHARIGALAGEALSLLGRAQVATARGHGGQARPLLDDALLLARESDVGHHTLDRIYGAMIEATEDPADVLGLIEEAEGAIRGPAETCPTCRIAFVVPAAIGAARAGDLERARRYAGDCERALAIIALPPAWHAAGAEVQGWLARAEERCAEADASFHTAAAGFQACGQPLDAERCLRLAVAS